MQMSFVIARQVSPLPKAALQQLTCCLRKRCKELLIYIIRILPDHAHLKITLMATQPITMILLAEDSSKGSCHVKINILREHPEMLTVLSGSEDKLKEDKPLKTRQMHLAKLFNEDGCGVCQWCTGHPRNPRGAWDSLDRTF